MDTGVCRVWPFSRRSKKPPPPRTEASCNFDLDNLETFLTRLPGLISSGFGAGDIQKVVKLARTMNVDDDEQLEFSIEFERKPAALKIQVVMDDYESPDVYFFTVPELAQRISNEMRQFAEELGI
jgi:hypothetical protein